MANTTLSPNMSLPVPTVGIDPGPDWAENINASLSIIDGHDHSSGSGVPITPDGMDITSDLPINDNNVTTVRSVNFYVQPAPLAEPEDLGCVYVSGADLYYNDRNGNQVRMTQGGSVTGSSGTITGLPSGTASASFAGATFTFQSATNTPATMNIGPIITGAASANPKTVTISASGAMPANIALTWPVSLPGATSIVSLDSSGNMASVSTTGSGNVVLATSPTVVTPVLTSPAITGGSITGATITTPTFTSATGTGVVVLATSPTIVTPVLTAPAISTPAFTGNPTGTVIGNDYTPTIGWGVNNPSAITSQNWYYMRIGVLVIVYGVITITAGSGLVQFGTVSIPIATASLNLAGTISVQQLTNAGVFVRAVNSGTTAIAAFGAAGNVEVGNGNTGSFIVSCSYEVL